MDSNSDGHIDIEQEISNLKEMREVDKSDSIHIELDSNSNYDPNNNNNNNNNSNNNSINNIDRIDFN